MIKKCFIDTETTGLWSEKQDEVHQISCIITDDHAKPLDYINLKFRPSETALENMHPEALQKCRLTKESIRSRSLDFSQAFAKFEEFLNKHVNRFDKTDKMQFIAYNAPFDLKFIQKYFLQNNNDYYGSYFWRPEICVYRELAWMLQNERDQFPSMHLSDMCKYAGIEFSEEHAHDAMYDTKKTLELFRQIYL